VLFQVRNFCQGRPLCLLAAGVGNLVTPLTMYVTGSIIK